MKKLFVDVIIFGLILTSVCTILGYFGSYSWFLDLFSHFRLQYLVLLLAGCLILLIWKKRVILVFISFLLINAFSITPLYLSNGEPKSTGEKFSILFMNLLRHNREHGKAISLIEKKQADIIILQEFSLEWQNALKPALSKYPHKIEIHRTDNFGIALYSKLPVKSLTEITPGSEKLPSIFGKIDLPVSEISIFATHPLPPIDQEYFESRNEQILALAEVIQNTQGPKILVGDLNMSSFSVHFRKLEEITGLNDSRKGFGIQPSWPTWLPIMGTALDHCLVSPELSVVHRETGLDIGSDHLPVYLEIGY